MKTRSRRYHPYGCKRDNMAEFLTSRRPYGTTRIRPTQTRLKRMSDEAFSWGYEKATGKVLRKLTDEEYNESLSKSRRFQRRSKNANKRKINGNH